MDIVDISNPSSPSQVGSIALDSYPYDIEISGSYAYVAVYDTGLQIIDISTPSSPAE